MKKSNIDDWINAGNTISGLRMKGITLPLADDLIASVAIRNEVEIFTRDKHFELIPGVRLRTAPT